MKKKISKKKTQKPRSTKRAPKKRTPSKKESTVLAEGVSTIGLHNLRPPRGAYEPRRVLGRGPSSGHGKTSSRGSKGQTSRSGRDTYLGFEGGQMPLIRKVPKRGFVSHAKHKYQVVNLEDIAKIKDKTINPQVLEENGLIKTHRKPIKILGDGEIKEAVTICAHAFSKKAQDKIKNAGGVFEVLND